MEKPNIPYGKQDISADDVQAVVQVLTSDWLTQGPAVEEFERTVADRCGSRCAVAVNSATSALHIACLAAGLGTGDRLWTSPNTFVASANCGLYCGATVDFVDIDPRTYNMSVTALETKLKRAEADGTLPKVLVPVHFAGQSCEMDRIAALADQYGFTVIEDASHAIGGSYRNNRIGCCAHAAMTVFSFHPVKIVTTGEGGMVLTNRQDIHEHLVRLRSHGITRDPARMEGESHGPWYYQQIELGFNYRMTDIQSALGTSQMTRLDGFIRRRSEIAVRYMDALRDAPITLPWQHPDAASAWHLFVLRIRQEVAGKTRLQVFQSLRNAGINVNVHYIPVHTQPMYQRLGFRPGDFLEAESYYREAISIPIYAALTDEQQEYVIDQIRKAVG